MSKERARWVQEVKRTDMTTILAVKEHNTQVHFSDYGLREEPKAIGLGRGKDSVTHVVPQLRAELRSARGRSVVGGLCKVNRQLLHSRAKVFTV